MLPRYPWHHVLLAVLVGALLPGCALFKGARGDNPWPLVTTATPPGPSGTPAEAIGFYSAGCLRGGVTLPPDGAGYQIVRLTRRRFYGHPLLIDYLKHLGQAVAVNKLGALLIGDLAQPRGGPTGSLHRSHQTGLDVDIWFTAAPEGGRRSMTLDERESFPGGSVVAADGRTLDPSKWTSALAKVLKLAATPDGVERIFVNAAIKRALCDAPVGKKSRPGDRAWLAKLRPWWGHDDHFHVRLACPPPGASKRDECKPQEPIPTGDGCDATLDWWFSDEAKLKAKEELGAGAAPMPVLPDACRDVLSAPAN